MKGNAMLHWLLHKIGIDKVTTQTSAAEQRVLSAICAKANSIIEIGVFEGYNTREFAISSPFNAQVFAIDPCFKGSLGFSYGKSIALKEWKRAGISNKISLLEGFSWDVAEKIPDNIDFIFIDGDHSFEGVKKDFQLYSKKISTKGFVALHDARIFENGWTKPDWGPVRLMNEIIIPSGEWEIVEEIDSLVILKAISK